MLSRLVRTAAVSAAVIAAALAGAVPAGAADAPVPLPPPQPVQDRDRLTVTVSETGNLRTNGTFQLECGPAGGTHPAAEPACARLDELARDGLDPFAPSPQDQMCTQQSGGPASARITGIWRGRQVDSSFSRTDGCEISRWQSLEPVLPNTRS
ncbi:subtilase-type protease inhibitor [Streptomyces sp. NBC_00390]|uniref:SSI family serine proteinase inhibitor n=1 Tax=Streptomyces sp. NBC_00390 TaxID=2975736 RepID=UPI002E235BA3